jgi:hypothetical protein
LTAYSSPPSPRSGAPGGDGFLPSPKDANTATAFILAYLTTGLFLRTAYQRYLGLLLGLAAVAVRIAGQEEREGDDMQRRLNMLRGGERSSGIGLPRGAEYGPGNRMSSP